MTYFDGGTYEPSEDLGRLGYQLAAVLEIMLDGEWWTLTALCEEFTRRTGRRAKETGISARIRDFRKDRVHEEIGVVLGVESERIEGGLWQYRLTVT